MIGRPQEGGEVDLSRDGQSGVATRWSVDKLSMVHIQSLPLNLPVWTLHKSVDCWS